MDRLANEFQQIYLKYMIANSEEYIAELDALIEDRKLSEEGKEKTIILADKYSSLLDKERILFDDYLKDSQEVDLLNYSLFYSKNKFLASEIQHFDSRQSKERWRQLVLKDLNHRGLPPFYSADVALAIHHIFSICTFIHDRLNTLCGVAIDINYNPDYPLNEKTERFAAVSFVIDRYRSVFSGFRSLWNLLLLQNEAVNGITFNDIYMAINNTIYSSRVISSYFLSYSDRIKRYFIEEYLLSYRNKTALHPTRIIVGEILNFGLNVDNVFDEVQVNCYVSKLIHEYEQNLSLLEDEQRTRVTSLPTRASFFNPETENEIILDNIQREEGTSYVNTLKAKESLVTCAYAFNCAVEIINLSSTREEEEKELSGIFDYCWMARNKLLDTVLSTTGYEQYQMHTLVDSNRFGAIAERENKVAADLALFDSLINFASYLSFDNINDFMKNKKAFIENNAYLLRNELIKEKAEKMMDTAQQQLMAQKGQYDSEALLNKFINQGIKTELLPSEVIDPLATGEKLYNMFVLGQTAPANVDYSCIVVLYFTALESLMTRNLYINYIKTTPLADENGVPCIYTDRSTLMSNKRTFFGELPKLISGNHIKDFVELGTFSYIYNEENLAHCEELRHYLSTIGVHDIQELISICTDVSMIKDLRNDAAHGLHVLSHNDATRVKNDIYCQEINRIKGLVFRLLKLLNN